MKPRRRVREATGRGAVLAAAITAACAGSSDPTVGSAPGSAGAPAVRAGAPAGVTTDTASFDPLAAERAIRSELTVGALPEIPAVTGPVAIRVIYPAHNQRIAVRDSNFLFGSVGTGDATLAINGSVVPVEPNGAFIAWLPVPEPDRNGNTVYRLSARNASGSGELELPVRIPPQKAEPDARLWMDPAALGGGLPRWALPDEELDFAVRATAGALVWIDAGGDRFHLQETEAEDPDAPTRIYRGTVTAGLLWEASCELARWVEEEEPTCGLGRVDEPEAGSPLSVSMVATDRFDTLVVEGELALGLVREEDPPIAELWEGPDEVNGQAGVVVGRPTAFGTYRWRFPNGTRARVDGRLGDRLRLRLVSGMAAWVLAEDARILPAGTPAPESPVGDIRIQPTEDALSLRVSLETPIPFEIDEPDDYTITLTLFGAIGTTDRMAYGGTDGLLESLRWEQLPNRQYRLWIRLRQPTWGFRAVWERGDATAYEGARAGAEAVILRLDVRRPPSISAEEPLRGIRIAIDPGHPGAGSTGPTGLFEGDANLAIAGRLIALLKQAGAVPVIIRNDGSSVGLYDRTARARAAGSHLFVSIHNNALPDGVRPFGHEGTSTYYFHPHARRLAETVQAGMLAHMRLRDLGRLWGNLAVARMSWMPAILTEGAFMMIPRHEAALRTPEFQEAYAMGVLVGIERFLAERANAR